MYAEVTNNCHPGNQYFRGQYTGMEERKDNF